MDPTNPTLCVIGVFCPALWRYGLLFSKKRYGVIHALKKALWRYEGAPAPPWGTPVKFDSIYVKAMIEQRQIVERWTPSHGFRLWPTLTAQLKSILEMPYIFNHPQLRRNQVCYWWSVLSISQILSLLVHISRTSLIDLIEWHAGHFFYGTLNTHCVEKINSYIRISSLNTP